MNGRKWLVGGLLLVLAGPALLLLPDLLRYLRIRRM